MNDEQKLLGLIPAKSLECLDSEDNLFIQSFLDQQLDFPWQELGVYQKIASLLPLALQLEVPDQQLKDDVALKLIKLSEELKAERLKEEEEEIKTLNKLEEEEANDVAVNMESENISEEYEPVAQNDFSIEENPLVENFNLDEIELPEVDAPEPFTLTDVQEEELKDHTDLVAGQKELEIEKDLSEENDLSEGNKLTEEPATFSEPLSEEIKIDNTFEDEIISEQKIEDQITEEKTSDDESNLKENFTPNTIESPLEKERTEKTSKYAAFQDTKKKSLDEKMFRALQVDFEELKSGFDETEKRLTRNLLMAYIAIAVLLALLIFSFFKFTSDIKSLEGKVEELNKKVTSQLIDQKEIKTDFYYYS